MEKILVELIKNKIFIPFLFINVMVFPISAYVLNLYVINRNFDKLNDGIDRLIKVLIKNEEIDSRAEELINLKEEGGEKD